MEQQQIVSRIVAQLPGANVEAVGADCSFSLNVTWQGFAGLKSLQRQQAVLRLFQVELSSGALHALNVVAKTPQELQDSLVSIQ